MVLEKITPEELHELPKCESIKVKIKMNLCKEYLDPHITMTGITVPPTDVKNRVEKFPDFMCQTALVTWTLEKVCDNYFHLIANKTYPYRMNKKLYLNDTNRGVRLNYNKFTWRIFYKNDGYIFHSDFEDTPPFLTFDVNESFVEMNEGTVVYTHPLKYYIWDIYKA
jgi:hypothetical protein